MLSVIKTLITLNCIRPLKLYLASKKNLISLLDKLSKNKLFFLKSDIKILNLTRIIPPDTLWRGNGGMHIENCANYEIVCKHD